MARTQWTEELVLKEAKKYTNMRPFIKESSGAYSFAKKHGLMDKVRSHMIVLKKKAWSLEELKVEATKYTTRTDFSKFSAGAYQYAIKNGHVDEVCSHMSSKFSRMTIAMVKEASKDFTTIREFRKSHERLYEFAQRKGLLRDLLGHLTGGFTSWTVEMLHEEGSKYSSRTEFLASNEAAYTASVKKGILDSVCANMQHGIRTFTDYDIPSNITGLYGLYRDDELVYIGKSKKCIYTRVMAHSKGKDFNKVITLGMLTPADTDVMEIYLINFHRPKYNVESNSNTTLNVVISNVEDVITSKIIYNKKDTHGKQ